MACAAGVGLGWLGGPAGMAGALIATLGCGAAFAGRSSSAEPSKAELPAFTPAGRQGASVMVDQVVPVWSRQMDVTREVATEGLAQILNGFSEMSSAVQTLTQGLDSITLAAEPGAVDGAVRRESPALAALLAPSQRAFAQRDAAVAELGRCSEALLELRQLAKEAREISRHTRLVAFNASIEAHRGQHQANDGSQTVATEVRMLADRMADTGERVGRRRAGPR